MAEAAEQEALSSCRTCATAGGAASYLDLLDAQRSLFAAQQSAVQANLQRLQNQVTLYRVLGGGWNNAQTATDGASSASATPARPVTTP